jgi:hydrogenase maturation protease
MTEQPRILVLGIGNLLWADEGFGVRAVEHLQRHYTFPDSVSLLDGGTQGMNLVAPVQEADVVVVLDAVDYGEAPGTLCRVADEDVPSFMGVRKMSLHQTGFQEVLAGVELLGDYPEHLLLVGVQPAVLEDYGGSLSEAVRAQIGPAAQAVLDYLARWDIHPEPCREGVRPEEASMPDGALDLHAYEAGRPAPEQAWRHGDPRFFQATGRGHNR